MSSRIGRRARSLVALAVVSAFAAGGALIAAATEADAQSVQPVPVVLVASGATAGEAAASCWEIKQLHPASRDGVYWLRTSLIERPERFYCDMTTDGGGWVLIGRGRDGWTFRNQGQSSIVNLADSISGPEAFAPAALSAVMIDGLLDGAAVASLPDGLRVRRAVNKDGSQWQEMRWSFQDLGAWSWALDGGHRLASFSIDGKVGTGSNTRDSSTTMWGETGSGNRSATDLNGWYTIPWSGHGRQAGFSYRGSVDGDRNDTSYLWEYNNEKQALPFTQLFIRPQVTSPVSAPIPDEGLGEQTLTPQLDERPMEIAGGVRNVLKVGDTEPGLDAPVLAIETDGDRVFVGGKFRDTRDTSTGELVAQSYLAAFDRATGAWIPSFRPVLDGTVWDLEVVAGRLIVAGQFTNIDGEAGTSALAALDPVTGRVDPTWRASMTVTGTTARPVVRSIDADGGWIYVAGNFTRIAGPANERSVGRLARVSVADGEPDTVFRPNVDGVPFDVDVADGLAQVVGNFASIGGVVRQSVGTVRTSDGSVVTGLADSVWTSGGKRYQFAVLPLGDEIWQGGSEHNTQVYRTSDHSLLKSYVTYDQGGDTQVLALDKGKVIQGSHANAFIYADATTWPGVTGYSRTDVFNWIGMFDAETHAYERDWVPSVASAYSEGTWAVDTDIEGCLWFGGDLLGGPWVKGQRQYLESFSKFCPRDTTAPTVPTNAVASARAEGGITVKWASSTDDVPGPIGYEVLRNDRVVSALVYGRSFVDPTGTVGDRYFVRAVDPTGNRSATTPLLPVGDLLAPTTPQNLQAVLNADQSVTLSWGASSDDVSVDGYRVFSNGVEVVLVPGSESTATLSGLVRGRYSFQVQAVDNAGNLSAKTPSAEVDVAGDDVNAPSVPTALSATAVPETASLSAAWEASTDDVGVTAYAVYRNGELVATVGGDVVTVQLDVGYGDSHIQVAARDAAGNESAKTAPVLVTITPPVVADTSNPSTPRDLAAVVNADGSVALSWTASRDNVGVASYRITRNRTEVMVVDGSQTSALVIGLGAGNHYLQVQAFDAAGNSSWRTPSALVKIVAPPPDDTSPPATDTSTPSTPRDLAAVVNADGSVALSWTASRDNVGVASYRITRNGVEVLVVPGSETAASIVGLVAGTHYLQVQAFDAAGNSSWRTPSVVVTVVGAPVADTSNPSTPRDLAAVVNADGSVALSWTASRDNVGVASYRITRNGVEVLVVPGSEVTALIVGLGPGRHHLQVQAFDAAGNSSWKTPSAVVDLP